MPTKKSLLERLSELSHELLEVQNKSMTDKYFQTHKANREIEIELEMRKVKQLLDSLDKNEKETDK